MPNIVRLGDSTTGHGCFPPTIMSSASSNVIVNSIGACKIGDSIVPHCCSSCHGGSQSSGSGNVNVNSSAVARVGDSISCGDMNAVGSSNVFAN